MKIFAALAAALLSMPSGATAQTSDLQPVPSVPTFRSSASIVALNVTVQDAGAHYVTDLQPSDFAVYEDGVRQDVRYFESSSVPVDLIVLIDTSSSMSDKMTVVHEAATGFLGTLRPGDRGAVVTFADTVNVRQPLTDDRARLDEAVRGTTARGETALYNAVYISLKQFGQAAQGSSSVRRQAIVVLSDGQDTSSLVSLDDVMELARRMGVNIYTVSLQSKLGPGRPIAGDVGRGFSDADFAMKEMARETGAQAFFPGTLELKRVYGSIAAEVAHQYSIGYVPVNGRADGRFRRIIVQIVTRPGLHSRTRLGYTAQGRATESSIEYH